jgi:homoserine dehydrogenase
MKDSIKVGIIGFGTVGTGVVKVILNNRETIRRRLGIPVEIAAIADRDLDRDRGIKIDRRFLTKDPMDVIINPDIDILVEVMGGINQAKGYILDAISRGKHIVTANKALLAEYGEEIYRAAEDAGVDLGFEGSVGGGIPVIKALKEGFDANRIESIFGIINGTSNYILTKMTEEGRPFPSVLSEAKEAGYAEADPTLDIEGIDAAHKLSILVNLAFGTPVSVKDIYVEGIGRITPLDIEYAREFGYRIKPLAIAKIADGEIDARVHPTMIPDDYLLAKVNGVFNAVYIVGDAAGESMLYGKGAGELPTGSAVVSDIIDIGRNIISASPCRVPVTSYKSENRKVLRVKRIEEISSIYYIRFMAMDSPGVLSNISGVLGKNNISISRVSQKGRKEGGSVPVVMMSHRANEKDIRTALMEIDGMPYISEKSLVIRVEGEEI